MKHRLLLLLLFVALVMTGWAQNSATPSYTVKGVLLDSLTQDGEPYATIKITTLNPQLHSRSATYIKRNGLLIRKITIKSSRPFQCAYHPLTP